MTFLLLPAGLLADASPTPTPQPYESPDFDLGAGPGLLVLVAFVFLAVAIYLIWRGMNKHLAKIEPGADGGDAPTADGVAPGLRARQSRDGSAPD